MHAIRKTLIVAALTALALGTDANGAALADPGGTPPLNGIARSSAASGEGTISGTVEDDSGSALADISVQVCLTNTTTCSTMATDTSGSYSVTGLADGSYQVDAQDTPLLPGSAGPVVISGGNAVTVNLVLLANLPLPPGVTIPGANGNPPLVRWGQPSPFSVSGRCPNGTASFSITQNGAVIASGPMTETPAGSGTYSGVIPPFAPNNHGYANVTITVLCPDGSTQIVPLNISIDRPAPAACSAVYSTPDSWSGGFQGQLVVTDTGNSPVNGWTLTWTFPDKQQITSLWNGTYTQSGEDVTVTSTSYDAAIQPGGSVSVGFTASYSGTNTAPSSVTCT